MKIDILTLFPEMFDGFKSESIIKRAIDNKKVDETKLSGLIKLLGLEDRRKHLPHELSGGQQQRTSINIIRSMILHMVEELVWF